MTSPSNESLTNAAVTAVDTAPTLPNANIAAPDPAIVLSNPGPEVANEGAIASAPNPPNIASSLVAPAVVQSTESATPAPATTPLVATPSPTPFATPVAGAPTSTMTPAEPTPTATSTALPANGLSFANVRTFQTIDGAGLLLYGDVINQSDSAQEIKLVTGQFLDGQGQVIADENRVSGYWPVEIVPPQDKVPFELYAEGIQTAADFKLRLDAQPSGSPPRRDFVVSAAYQENDEFGLCLGGTLQNSGGEIQDYLVIAAVLYDAENKMISFGDTFVSPAMATTGQSEEFEICADSFGQNIGRYELQAWGR
jgi:hypothetical protein